MALSAKVGTFATGTGAAGTTVAVTGVGFQPAALIFWWSGRTEATNTTAGGSYSRGIGFAVSATQRGAVYSASTDALAAAECDKGHNDAACVGTLTTAGVVDGLLDLQSMDSDGFTLAVDDQFATSIRVSYLALGGDSLTNAAVGNWVKPATATGTQDITGLGFQPDAVLFASVADSMAAPPDTSPDGMLTFGAATASAAYVLSNAEADGNATIAAKSYCFGGELMVNHHGGNMATIGRVAFSAMLADGFQVNWLENTGSANQWIFYLALKGGNYLLGDLLTQTDTVTTIAESSFGFAPSALIVASHGQAQSTQDTVQAGARWSIGAATSTTDRVVQATWTEDGTANSETAMGVAYDAVYLNISSADAVQGLMDVQSFDSDGFTTIMDDADPSQAFAWYLAVGPAGGGATQYSQSAAGTLGSTGALVKRTNTAPSGTLSSSGTIGKRIGKAAAGTLASAGAIVKRTGKAAAGALSSAGALAATRVSLVSVGGTLSSAGALVKQARPMLAGTLSSAGTLAKRAAKALAGVLSSAGAFVAELLRSDPVIHLPALAPLSNGSSTTAPLGISGTLAPLGVASGTTLALASAGTLAPLSSASSTAATLSSTGRTTAPLTG